MHSAYRKITLAHKYLKSEKLYKESFQISVILAKLAQEQMEIEHPGFQQYRCSICGKGEHHKQMFAAHPKHLEYHGIVPIYQMPPDTVYPVCTSCNQEYFKTDDELDDTKSKPDYSEYRRSGAPGHQCMKCRKSLEKVENHSCESFDYARIHAINLTKEHFELAENLGSGDELPLCDECEIEIEREATKVCAVCGHEEDEDDMTEVDLQLIIDTDNHPEYRLDNDGEYPVCNDCYFDEMHERCDRCSQGYISTELETVEYPNGHSGSTCESCRSELFYCDTCNSAIDTEDGNYHMGQYSGEVFCENHLPTNDNDFDSLDVDANVALDSMLEPMFVDSESGNGYHLSVNPKIIEKLQRTFGHALKKYTGEYMPDKVGRHLMKIIDQLAIEDGEKKHLKEFLCHPLNCRPHHRAILRICFLYSSSLRILL